MPIPVIIDTDPGLDDALAILLAFASPELEVLGLTTVGGNAGLAHTTRNALRLLHLIGRDDVPVAAGANTPLVRQDAVSAAGVHGDDGFGGVPLAEAPRGADDRPAVRLLVDLIEGSAEPVTLIALGPLTNVATLLAAYPGTAAKLAKIVLMGGGAEHLGNVTPTAEFNIWYDPDAASRVFASGLPITMIGLDVTHKAITFAEDWEPLRAQGGPVAEAVAGMVDFYTRTYRENLGIEGTAQHDALAVAAVIAPELVTTSALHVGVECSGPLTIGMTVVDLRNVTGKQPNADVGLDVDAVAFNSLLIGRIMAINAATTAAGQAG
ncbi:MAG: nucleoside hydrolase [Terracoccus sp.]